jgi:hypothetical protein
MEAVRCLRCGETRWALFRASYERMLSRPCEACGGETAAERRRPGASLREPLTERRDRRRASASTRPLTTA